MSRQETSPGGRQDDNHDDNRNVPNKSNITGVTGIVAALKSAVESRDTKKIEEILDISSLPQLLDEEGSDSLKSYITSAVQLLYGNQVKYISEMLDFVIQNKNEKMMVLLFKCNLTPLKEENIEIAYFWAGKMDAGFIMDILIKRGLMKNDITSQETEHNYITAVQSGYFSVVNHYVKRRVYVNVRDSDGHTALMLAIQGARYQKLHDANIKRAVDCNTKNGYHQIIELILGSRPHIEAIDDGFFSALMWAVKCQNEAIVKLIIDNYPDAMFQRNNYSFTPLMLAAIYGFEKIVAILVDQYKLEVSDINRTGYTSVIIAAMKGHLKVVHVLLEYGGLAQLRIADRKGRTALICAAQFGHCEVVEYLITKRLKDLNKSDYRGRTCLMYAAMKGHSSVVKYLIAKKADVTISDEEGRTALMHAALNGHNNIVKLLGTEEEINVRDSLGFTALDLAIQNNLLNTVKALLLKNAVVDANSLKIAAMAGNCKTFQLLETRVPSYQFDYDLNCKYYHCMHFRKKEDEIFSQFFKKKLTKEKFETLRREANEICNEFHAKVSELDAEAIHAWLEEMPYFPLNVENQDGKTALTVAIENDNVDVVKALLNRGADPNGSLKNWPIKSAIRFNSVPILQLLLEYGAEVNQVSEEKTPLYIAAQYNKQSNRMDIIKCLANHGADPFITKTKNNALDHAITDKDAELTKYLFQFFHIMPLKSRRLLDDAANILQIPETIKELNFDVIAKLISVRSDYFVLDVNYRGGYVKDVPMIYRAIDNLQVLILLESKGARVFCKEENLTYLSPLMIACTGRQKRIDTIVYLCENYKEMIDYCHEIDGRTALMICATKRKLFEDTEYHEGDEGWENLQTLLIYEPDLTKVRPDKYTVVELALVHDVYPLYYWLTQIKGMSPDLKKFDAKIQKKMKCQLEINKDRLKNKTINGRMIRFSITIMAKVNLKRQRHEDKSKQQQSSGWSESLTNVASYSWNFFKGLFWTNREIDEIERALMEVLQKIPKSEITKILECFEESDPEVSDEEDLSTSKESAYDSDDEGEPTLGPAKSYSTTETNTELTMQKLTEILGDPSVKEPSPKGNQRYKIHKLNKKPKHQKKDRDFDRNEDYDLENLEEMRTSSRERPKHVSEATVRSSSEQSLPLFSEAPIEAEAPIEGISEPMQGIGFDDQKTVEGDGVFTGQHIHLGETTFFDTWESCIGEGSDGTKVFSGVKTCRIDPDHPVRVAVKCLGSGRQSLVQREIRNLAKLRTHTNVISYLEVVSLQDNMYILLEHCDKSLEQMMTDLVDNYVTLDISPRNILWQATQGLIHLHHLNIVHRDLKPSNILLKECNGQHVVKLSDFHRSKLFEKEEASVSEGVKGTTGWRSPELYRIVKGPDVARNFISSATDVFSLGLIFYHVVSDGKYAQEGNTPENREKTMMKHGCRLVGKDVGEKPEFPTILNLVQSMTEMKASDRVKAREILLHPYFWDRFKKRRFIEMVNRLARDKHDVKDALGETSRAVFEQLHCQNNWWNLFSETVQDDIYVQLEKGRTTADESGNTYPEQELQDGSSLFALIRVMRNRLEHFYEYDYNIRAEMGGSPDSCLDFFCNKCPYLIPEVFQALKDMNIQTDDYLFFYNIDQKL